MHGGLLNGVPYMSDCNETEAGRELDWCLFTGCAIRLCKHAGNLTEIAVVGFKSICRSGIDELIL